MSETKLEIITILLAIQQKFVCNGVKAIFSPFDDIQVIGEIDSFENLTDSVKTQLPEIVITSTSEMNPVFFDCVKTIKASYPEVSVIIMFKNFEDELIYTALGLGVSACLTTGVHSDELITCLRKVWHGENPIFDTLTRPGIARLILRDMGFNLNGNITDAIDTRKTLTDREIEILHLVADGFTWDQIISNINSSDSDIIQHLTSIYGKLIFNNFCEFSPQPSEKSISHDQSTYGIPIEENTNKLTTDFSNPERNIERENIINDSDLRSELATSIRDSFEVITNELQETLEKLAPVDDHPMNIPEEEHIEPTGNNEGNITKFEDSDEPLSEVMMELHNQEFDDSEIIDREHSTPSESNSEEMPLIREDEIQNSESNANEFVVNKEEKFSEVLQDTPGTIETTEELEVKENEESVKQKAKWFRFLSKRDNKIGSNNNQSSKNDNRPENTKDSDKPELDLGKESDLAKDEKESLKRINRNGKDTIQTEREYSHEGMASSVKGLGVPVFIKTPVDGKQLEKLESIIKEIDSLNITLRKGTAQEYILVISGQDPAILFKTLSNIPLVESTSDENGIINITLLPINDMDYLS